MDGDDDVIRPVPAGWLEALAESEADLAAGRVVSSDVVMAQLSRTIAEMEAEGAVETGDAALHR